MGGDEMPLKCFDGDAAIGFEWQQRRRDSLHLAAGWRFAAIDAIVDSVFIRLDNSQLSCFASFGFLV